ncbi:MAG TPA: cupin domain-containing protein [Pyrinomonadaceae bacterium]|nr:cupin domain-containing protein [Pyrinomonadaceae bacterium]
MDAPEQETESVLTVDDVNAAVHVYTRHFGYLVEMIGPADAPVEAVLRRGDRLIRLESNQQGPDRPLNQPGSGETHSNPIISRGGDNAAWTAGRAGMEYRDLVPGRLDGALIASQIRIPVGGDVEDYIHYHKLQFQLIYCLAGAIKLVYEDQGESFWMRPGDAVLQPPEIRHRVLEAEPGSEVIEVAAPSGHETWADNEIHLPTGRLIPSRKFGGQSFARRNSADGTPVYGIFGGFEAMDLGISAASGGAASVFQLRSTEDNANFGSAGVNQRHTFYYVLNGRLKGEFNGSGEHSLTAGDSIMIPPKTNYNLVANANVSILCVMT